MLNLTLNMENKDYTKIKLRDFRHNLSQLKDSLSYGQVYEITEKGKSLAYFIPSSYEVKLQKKKSSRKEILEALDRLQKSIPEELKKRIEKEGYEKLYREEMEKKYLRK